MNRELAGALVGFGLACFGFSAQAANWLQLQGNEAPDAPVFKPIIFLEPTYTHINADPIQGLKGAQSGFNGRMISNNQVMPNFEHNDQFQLLHARVGARGALTNRINYFAMIEAGRNPMTEEHDVMISDLSLTFNHIPGARIRAGLFKLPTSEEALVALNDTFPYVYFSNATMNLLIEQPVRHITASMPAGLLAGEKSSGCNCFHDWGIQVYDWFNHGDWEISYALAISNGNNIRSPNDSDGNKDITWRMQASRLFGGASGPNREDLSVFVWRQSGERNFGDTDYRRDREGVGFKVVKGPFRTSGEYLRGHGMIVGGYYPSFSDQALAIGVDEKAHGNYLEGGWRFIPDWEVNLRYDTLHQMTETPANARDVTTTTLGLRYFVNKSTNIIFNYEWREKSVTNPSAIRTPPPSPTNVNLHNALAEAANWGDRVSLQLNWFF